MRILCFSVEKIPRYYTKCEWIFYDFQNNHDDIIKWKYFPRYWTFLGESIGTGGFPSQKPVTRSSDVFFDMRLNKNWANNWQAGDLKRHRAHYDVIIMIRYVKEF